VTRGGNIPETTTRTILQNIKVFAVNDVVSLDTAGQETKNIQARTVSLLVTPAQAERVTLASEMGNIRLVLRPIDDESEVDTGGDTVSSIFGKPLSGNRKEEEKGNPPAGESKDGGFLALLEQMRNKKAAEQTPAPPKDPAHHCVMRVLAGPNVQIFDLESDGPGDALADAGFWKVSGQKAALPGSDKDLPEVKRPAASLAPAPAETPKPPQDEKAKDKKPKDAKSL
jgi:pilus assembly protein CpaB